MWQTPSQPPSHVAVAITLYAVAPSAKRILEFSSSALSVHSACTCICWNFCVIGDYCPLSPTSLLSHVFCILSQPEVDVCLQSLETSRQTDNKHRWKHNLIDWDYNVTRRMAFVRPRSKWYFFRSLVRFGCYEWKESRESKQKHTQCYRVLRHTTASLTRWVYICAHRVRASRNDEGYWSSTTHAPCISIFDRRLIAHRHYTYA